MKERIQGERIETGEATLECQPRLLKDDICGDTQRMTGRQPSKYLKRGWGNRGGDSPGAFQEEQEGRTVERSETDDPFFGSCQPAFRKDDATGKIPTNILTTSPPFPTAHWVVRSCNPKLQTNTGHKMFCNTLPNGPATLENNLAPAEVQPTVTTWLSSSTPR